MVQNVEGALGFEITDADGCIPILEFGKGSTASCKAAGFAGSDVGKSTYTGKVITGTGFGDLGAKCYKYV